MSFLVIYQNKPLKFMKFKVTKVIGIHFIGAINVCTEVS